MAMVINFPLDDNEFHLNWTHCAGKRTGLETAVQRLNEEAARLFVRDHNVEANEMRRVARDLGKLVDRYGEELSAYINEDEQRRAEIQRKQPGRPDSDISKRGRQVRGK